MDLSESILPSALRVRGGVSGLIGMREAGLSPPALLSSTIAEARTRRVELSSERMVEAAQLDGVSALDMEARGQYLLAGGMEGSISAYDVEGRRERGNAGGCSSSPSSPPGSRGVSRCGGLGMGISVGAGDGGGGGGAVASMAKVRGAFCVPGRGTRPRDMRRPVGGQSRGGGLPPVMDGSDEAVDQLETPVRLSPDSQRSHSKCVNSVQWYPVDTGLFMSSGNDGRVLVWATESLEVVTDFSFEKRIYKAVMPRFPGAHCLIAVGLKDAGIRLCDMESGACVHTLLGNRSPVHTLAWSPRNEHILVSGSSDGTILFFDVRRAGPFMMLDEHNASAATFDVSIEHLRMQGQIPPALQHKGHRSGVNAVEFTPDGLHVVSTGSDGRVRLWDAVTGRNTMINYANTPKLREGSSIAISPDNKVMFLPGGWDVTVYEVFTGKQLDPLMGHFDRVSCTVFHPTEQELYSAAGDSQILIWHPQIT